eukprot:m.229740 g.229740  ORF g.229740 m.229740 type:complete len:139 (-) comp33564_c5_seq1:165-581(-)
MSALNETHARKKITQKKLGMETLVAAVIAGAVAVAAVDGDDVVVVAVAVVVVDAGFGVVDADTGAGAGVDADADAGDDVDVGVGGFVEIVVASAAVVPGVSSAPTQAASLRDKVADMPGEELVKGVSPYSSQLVSYHT